MWLYLFLFTPPKLKRSGGRTTCFLTSVLEVCKPEYIQLYELLCLKMVLILQSYFLRDSYSRVAEDTCFVGYDGVSLVKQLPDVSKDSRVVIVEEISVRRSNLAYLALRIKIIGCFETSGSTCPKTQGSRKHALSSFIFHTKQMFTFAFCFR